MASTTSELRDDPDQVTLRGHVEQAGDENGLASDVLHEELKFDYVIRFRRNKRTDPSPALATASTSTLGA
jgi:hypothetical protein